jgi:DNA helicase II / ATP-dependent DNA helicase PcrA
MSSTTQRPLELTPQLSALLDWGRKSKRSLTVVSYAGTGKTTSGVALCRVMAGTTFFGSYNAAIAREIQNKLDLAGINKSKVTAATFHSMGHRAWGQHIRTRLSPDGDKVSNILTALIEESDTRRMAMKVKAVRRKNIITLVSFAKQHCIGVGNKADTHSIPKFVEMAQRYGLDEELAGGNVEDLAELAILVFNESLSRVRTSIDFDDQLYAPLYHGAPLQVFDNVIIDESQDTATNRRLLAYGMMRKPNGRLVAIGDPNQAIYRFAGADSDAMDIITQELKSETLPLSVTYRCPKAVVAEAQRFVSDFTAHETAPDGIVERIDYKQRRDGGNYLKLSDLKPGQAVLCRNTRPLIELLYDLLDAGRPVKLEGSTPLQAFLSLIDQMDVTSLTALEAKLANYCVEQRAKWEEKSPEKLQRVMDKVETVVSISRRIQRKGAETTSALANELRKVFESDGPSWGPPKDYSDRILLTTIHKSKGREWDTVYILGANLFMPSKYAKKPEDIRQEKNLEYVAITRSKNRLVWVACKKEDFGAGVPSDAGDKPAVIAPGFDQEAAEEQGTFRSTPEPAKIVEGQPQPVVAILEAAEDLDGPFGEDGQLDKFGHYREDV